MSPKRPAAQSAKRPAATKAKRPEELARKRAVGGDLDVRTKILQGAALVFADVGVRAASVEDILATAGVSRRTFYRFYESKESVMVALYEMGTDALLGMSAIAASEGATPLERVTGAIDAHLRNAATFGRLVFVLGGEAHRHESLLHKRRMEVHEALIGLFASAVRGSPAADADPLLFRGVVLAVEGVTRRVLEEGDEGRSVSKERLDRARSAMIELVTGALRLG